MINDGTDGQTDRLADKTLAFIIARFAICITHGKKRPALLKTVILTDVTFKKIQDGEPVPY